MAKIDDLKKELKELTGFGGAKLAPSEVARIAALRKEIAAEERKPSSKQENLRIANAAITESVARAELEMFSGSGITGPASERWGTRNLAYWREAFALGKSQAERFRVEDNEGKVVYDPGLEGYRIGAGARGVSGDTNFPYRQTAQLAGVDYPAGIDVPVFIPTRDAAYAAGMSIPDAMEFYMSLEGLELVKFQNDLFEAGLYQGTQPVLGMRDGTTNDAFTELISMSMANPEKPLDQLIKGLKRSNLSTKMETARKELFGNVGATKIEYTPTETLKSMLDTIGQDLFGEYLDPAVKDQLVAKLQAQEIGAKTAQHEENLAAAGGTTSKELDAFIDALGSDGGGPYGQGFGGGQFASWVEWAGDAGMDPRDISEGNRRRVMKHKLSQYHSLYGNWRDTALAWAASANRGAMFGSDPDDYANGVVSRMNTALFAPVVSGGTAGSPAVREGLDSPQVRAAAEMKRLNPAGYTATQFSKQANAFFNLLDRTKRR